MQLYIQNKIQKLKQNKCYKIKQEVKKIKIDLKKIKICEYISKNCSCAILYQKQK